MLHISNERFFADTKLPGTIYKQSPGWIVMLLQPYLFGQILEHVARLQYYYT